jgi:replicative DNA helicase
MELKIEQLVVWCLIQTPEDVPEVSNIITPDDFIDSTCRHAFQTIQRMSKDGKDVDLPSLYLEMGRPANISTLIENEDGRIFPAPHYALLLKKRNVEDAVHKSVQAREYEETQERIKQLQDLSKPTSLLTISKMVEQTVQVKQAYPTGYTDLDGLVAFRPSDLLILAGRTSIGKSTFGLTVLSNMAMSFPVGMVSFEMSPGGVAERLSKICSMNYLSEIESNFFVACPTAFNLMNTRKAISDMVKTKKIRVVMVDFLQLMQEQRRFTSRHLEVSYIIRQLKELAKEFQLGLIVVAQLSRAIDTRGENARPVLGDLKETGDIEHAADIVLFLHRAKHDKEAELIVAKNRYGGKGIVQLVWIEDKTKYGSREWKREPGEDE